MNCTEYVKYGEVLLSDVLLEDCKYAIINAAGESVCRLVDLTQDGRYVAIHLEIGDVFMENLDLVDQQRNFFHGMVYGYLLARGVEVL